MESTDDRLAALERQLAELTAVLLDRSVAAGGSRSDPETPSQSLHAATRTTADFDLEAPVLKTEDIEAPAFVEGDRRRAGADFPPPRGRDGRDSPLMDGSWRREKPAFGDSAVSMQEARVNLHYSRLASGRSVPELRSLGTREVQTFRLEYERYASTAELLGEQPFDLLASSLRQDLPSFVAMGLLRHDYMSYYRPPDRHADALNMLQVLVVERDAPTWSSALADASKVFLPADATAADWLTGAHGFRSWDSVVQAATLCKPRDMTMHELNKRLHRIFCDDYLRMNQVLADHAKERPISTSRSWLDFYQSFHQRLLRVNESRDLYKSASTSAPADGQPTTARGRGRGARGRGRGRRGGDDKASEPWAVCFGCGKRGHRMRDCKADTWEKKGDKIISATSGKPGAFPDGVKTPKDVLKKVKAVSVASSSNDVDAITSTEASAAISEADGKTSATRKVAEWPRPEFPVQVKLPDGNFAQFSFFHDTGDQADICSSKGVDLLRSTMGEAFEEFTSYTPVQHELGGPTTGSVFRSVARLTVTCMWSHDLLPHDVIGKIVLHVVPNLDENFMLSYTTSSRLRLNKLFARDDGKFHGSSIDTLHRPTVKRVIVSNPFTTHDLISSARKEDWDDGVDESDGTDAFPAASVPVADVQRPTMEDELLMYTPAPGSDAARLAAERGTLLGVLPKIDNPFGEDDIFTDICKEYADCFSMQIPKLSCDLEPLLLVLKPGAVLPRPTRGRRWPYEKQLTIDENVTNMRHLGIIQLSKSPTASQVLVVPKPHQPGKFRFCIDLRPVNEACVLPVSVLPLADELMESVRGSRWFASLDITSCYWQFDLAEECRHLCAFIVGTNVYEPSRVPFGAHAAPGHVNSELTNLLADVNGVKVFLDDLLLHAPTREGLALILRQVLERLRSVGLVLRPDKCHIGTTEVHYLGHTIDGDGKRIQESRVDAIKNFDRPHTVKQLRRFLGVTNFVRSYCKGFATTAAPLYAALKGRKNRNEKLEWEQQLQAAFDSVKELICSASALFHYDPALPTIVRSDASAIGWGAVLLQAPSPETDIFSDDLRPIAYLSGRWTGAQTRWSVVEQECAALVFACQKWEHYLSCKHFILQCDHKNLVWLRNNTNPKVNRWAASLLPYKFSICHIDGEKNTIADMLSRPFSSPPQVSSSSLIQARAMRIRTRSTTSTVDDTSSQVDLEFLEDEAADDHRWPAWVKTCELISEFHNSTAGHRGITATIRALESAGHDWPTRSQDVRAFILACATCQATDPRIRPAINLPLGFITSSRPFEEWHFDWVGPFPPDRFGRRYLLVIIDVFSRFTEIVPAVSNTAIEAARALLQVFGRYGAPGVIRCDNDPSFLSHLSNHLYEMLGIKITTSVPYDSKTNGVVERCNKEILRHVRALIFDKPELQDLWAESIPIVMRIINSTQSVSTGVAAMTLLYCGQVPADRFLPHAPTTPPALKGAPAAFLLHLTMANSALLAADDDYMASRFADYIEERKIFNDAVVANILGNQPSRSDADSTSTHDFNVGDLVLLSYPARPPSKLSAKMRGPFKIFETNNNIIRVQSLVSSTSYRVDASRLRKWTQGDLDPVAAFHRAEDGSFEVEEIIDFGISSHFVGGDALASDYVFLIHWKGYEVEDRTWEDFNSVKHLDEIKTFFKNLDPQHVPEVFRKFMQ